MSVSWLNVCFFFLFLQLIVVQAALHDNSVNCSCYKTNGVQPASFLYHRFFDFRHIPLSQTKGQYFKSAAWTNDWYSQQWGADTTDDASVRMQNDPRNVFIAQRDNFTYSDTGDDYDTYLALRTTRLPDSQSTGEVENLQKNLMYASIRLRARVVGDPGACAGMFTYYDEDNETDIEILTAEPKDRIHYSNQPTVDSYGEVIPQSGVKAAVPASWTDWNDHRIDWLPDRASWYINGVHVTDNTYSVPRKPSCLIMNMWSNGGIWTGNMRVGGSAELQIQWVDMVFNTSGPVTGPPGATTYKRETEGPPSRIMRRKEEVEAPCEVQCAVDGIKKVGFPEVIRKPAATSLGSHAYGTSKRATLASLLTGSLMFKV